jgi:putative SOS response-associated peptidase YedK
VRTIQTNDIRRAAGGKIPYSISVKDDSPFVFGGLGEGWKDPANGERLYACTIITGEPNEFVREIHTRMPVFLKEKHHPADRMKAWPRIESGT